VQTDLSTYGVLLVNNGYFLVCFCALLVGHALYYR